MNERMGSGVMGVWQISQDQFHEVRHRGYRKCNGAIPSTFLDREVRTKRCGQRQRKMIQGYIVRVDRC